MPSPAILSEGLLKAFLKDQKACPRPDSKPSVVPSSHVVENGEESEDEKDKNEDEEEYPIEAQINNNCGQRFVGRIVNGKVTRAHELPFMVRIEHRNIFWGSPNIRSYL